jgi:hypothetical protein
VNGFPVFKREFLHVIGRGSQHAFLMILCSLQE